MTAQRPESAARALPRLPAALALVPMRPRPCGDREHVQGGGRGGHPVLGEMGSPGRGACEVNVKNGSEGRRDA